MSSEETVFPLSALPPPNPPDPTLKIQYRIPPEVIPPALTFLLHAYPPSFQSPW